MAIETTTRARSRQDRPSLHRRRDARPFFHLHAGNEFVATVLGPKDRGLALFDVEPVLAERINDVRLVRNENRVGYRAACEKRRYGG